MFADDTNIFAKGKDIDNLVNNINYELEHISKFWQQNYTISKIMLSNTEIPVSRVQETKFFGVIIQEKLNWSHQLELLSPERDWLRLPPADSAVVGVSLLASPPF